MKRYFFCLIVIFVIFSFSYAQVTPIDENSWLKQNKINDSLLLNLYQQGYLAAERDTQGIIQQGNLYRIGKITVTKNPQKFTSQSLRLENFTGQWVTKQILSDLQSTIANTLMDSGFTFAALQWDVEENISGQALDLTLTLNCGPGYKFGGFKAHGSRIQPDVLERLSLLKFGENFNIHRIQAAEEKISRLGYFDRLEARQLFRDSTRYLLYPELLLSDFKGNRLSGLLGYDSENKGQGGLLGYLDIHLINMAGTARDLDFHLNAQSLKGTPAETQVKVDYTEPWLYLLPIGAKASLALSLQDSVYNERKLGLGIFQDIDFHSKYQVNFGLQHNENFVDSTQSDAKTIGFELIYDARDKVPYTLRGEKISGSVEGIRRELADTTYYVLQNKMQTEGWIPFGKRWVGYGRLSAAGNWPLRVHPNRGELFQIGGTNSIRGYRENEFLTDLFVYANLELQFILSARSRVSLFGVPAWINQLGSGDIDWQRVAGYGFGLDLGNKDWVFGISYALNPDRSLGNGLVHVHVVNQF